MALYQVVSSGVALPINGDLIFISLSDALEISSTVFAFELACKGIDFLTISSWLSVLFCSLLGFLPGFFVHQRFVMVFDQVLRQLSLVLVPIVDNRISDIFFAKQQHSSIGWIGEHGFDRCRHEVIAFPGLRSGLIHPGYDVSNSHAVGIVLKHLCDDPAFGLIHDQIITFPVVTKDWISSVWNALFKALLDCPADVIGDVAAFLLGKRSHDG